MSKRKKEATYTLAEIESALLAALCEHHQGVERMLKLMRKRAPREDKTMRGARK